MVGLTGVGCHAAKRFVNIISHQKKRRRLAWIGLLSLSATRLTTLWLTGSCFLRPEHPSMPHAFHVHCPRTKTGGGRTPPFNRPLTCRWSPGEASQQFPMCQVAQDLHVEASRRNSFFLRWPVPPPHPYSYPPLVETQSWPIIPCASSSRISFFSYLRTGDPKSGHGKGRGQERGCCAACRILLLGHTTVSLPLGGRRPPVWTSTPLPTDRQSAMECLSSHTKAQISSHAGSRVTEALMSSSIIAGVTGQAWDGCRMNLVPSWRDAFFLLRLTFTGSHAGNGNIIVRVKIWRREKADLPPIQQQAYAATWAPRQEKHQRTWPGHGEGQSEPQQKRARSWLGKTNATKDRTDSTRSKYSIDLEQGHDSETMKSRSMGSQKNTAANNRMETMRLTKGAVPSPNGGRESNTTEKGRVGKHHHPKRAGRASSTTQTAPPQRGGGQAVPPGKGEVSFGASTQRKEAT